MSSPLILLDLTKLIIVDGTNNNLTLSPDLQNLLTNLHKNSTEPVHMGFITHHSTQLLGYITITTSTGKRIRYESKEFLDWFSKTFIPDFEITHRKFITYRTNPDSLPNFERKIDYIFPKENHRVAIFSTKTIQQLLTQNRLKAINPNSPETFLKDSTNHIADCDVTSSITSEHTDNDDDEPCLIILDPAKKVTFDTESEITHPIPPKNSSVYLYYSMFYKPPKRADNLGYEAEDINDPSRICHPKDAECPFSTI